MTAFQKWRPRSESAPGPLERIRLAWEALYGEACIIHAQYHGWLD
jgi:hypothetical protein